MLRQHAVRIVLLMIGVAIFLTWLTSHAEVTFANGLRHIRQSEQLDRESSGVADLRGIDHPLHSLAIVAVHRVIGGVGPVSWQRAAQAVSLGCLVLLVIPLYLFALEVYDADAAWIGCTLFFANPMTAYVGVNVLSETTFLLFWTWGLWSAVRFLREGKIGWLPLTAGFAALAYLARAEAIVLPVALCATLAASPWHWATRLTRNRWWAAVVFLILGAIVVLGTSRVDREFLGKKPSITTLIDSSAVTGRTDLERDRLQPPGQSKARLYRVGVERMVKALRNAVTIPMIPLVVLGCMLTWPWTSQARVWILQGLILALSSACLVWLHVSGGYGTVRHALVPGMLLILLAAEGLAAVLRSVVVDGRWFGIAGGYYRPGPVLWAVALIGLTVPTLARTVSPNPGSFAVYRAVGDWIAGHTGDDGRVLDMTDWSLYFSGRSGYTFANVYEAAGDPRTRWVILRDAHVKGHWRYSAVLQGLLEGMEPIATLPEHPRPGQLRVHIYDLRTQPVAAVPSSPAPVRR